VLKKQSPDPNDLFCRAFECEEAGKLRQAIRLYEMSARRGFSSACVNLGNIFASQLKPPNIWRARYWYKRAYELGHPAGAYNIAVDYKKAGNRRWHEYWLGKAVERGYEDAVKEYAKLKKMKIQDVRRMMERW
jgi:TPR repeat protein